MKQQIDIKMQHIISKRHFLKKINEELFIRSKKRRNIF